MWTDTYWSRQRTGNERTNFGSGFSSSCVSRRGGVMWLTEWGMMSRRKNDASMNPSSHSLSPAQPSPAQPSPTYYYFYYCYCLNGTEEKTAESRWFFLSPSTFFSPFVAVVVKTLAEADGFWREQVSRKIKKWDFFTVNSGVFWPF